MGMLYRRAPRGHDNTVLEGCGTPSSELTWPLLLRYVIPGMSLIKQLCKKTKQAQDLQSFPSPLACRALQPSPIPQGQQTIAWGGGGVGRQLRDASLEAHTWGHCYSGDTRRVEREYRMLY